jgi:HEAT repeat protein
MSLSEDGNKLATLLVALTQPDTNAIREAEVALKPILKDARSIPALMEVLEARGTQPDAVRHVSAVLLRKRLPSHYSSFDPDTKTTIQTKFLSLLTSEPERTVRNGAGSIATTIFKLDAGTPPGWTDLLQFIATAASDANPEARELAFILLAEMTETIGESYREQFASLFTLFGTALSDSDAKVQSAAVKSLGQLMSYLSDEKEVEVFSPLLPNILNVAGACLKRKDEDTVSVTLDVLYDLSYSPSPAISAMLPAIVQFCLMCLSNGDLEMGVRDSAALVVATLAESKPKTFGKDEALLASVLETLFSLIENSPDSAAGALFESNPAWRDDFDNDQDDTFDSPSETSMAQGTLDMLACEIPKKYIFRPVIERAIRRLSSDQPNQRKAGVACLGVIAEGCSEPMQEYLPDIIPHVLAAAGDQEPQVRECACFALGQLSEHCQPRILTYSDRILPIVFALLDDATISVQATSCYVLEMFCERLEPEGVRPMLEPLVRKLGGMLESTPKRSVKEMAVAAMAATAVAAEEEFAPFLPAVAQIMSQLMVLEDEKFYTLRGRALECMGHMAIAVGKENFRPYFAATMKCACEGLTTDSTDLKEFAYALFANLGKVMGEEFAPVLGELVPHLVDVIKQDEGSLEQAEEQKEAFSTLDDSDDEGEGGNYVLQVRTALLEAKKGAITALGEMAAHTGAAYVPYLEESVSVLQASATNWHPIIKSVTAEALPSLVIPSVAANHNGEIEYTKGDTSGTSPLSPHTTAVVGAVLNELLTLMKDEDKETVGKACEGIQSVIELCGPYALAPIANECLANTHALLSRTAPCQGEWEEGEDEDDDHESYMTSVCDLVGAFGRVMGAQFVPYLDQFLPQLCYYAKSSRPASDRSMAIGCMGEIAQEVEGGIAGHWTSVFFPAIMAGLADADDNVKRNAAFCAGVSSEALGADASIAAASYPQLLQGLSPLFGIDASASDGSAACVDNAAAAVSRMIMASPANVPLATVLPALLKALPLKNDHTENETVYKCVLGLMSMNCPELAEMKGELRRIFGAAVADDNVNDEIKAQLNGAAGALA